MRVRIFRPSKTAMQSGRGHLDLWVVEPDRAARLEPDPLMGWVSSRDTLNTVKLRFPTQEDAIAYVRKQGWQFTVDMAHERRIKPKAYADNFRHDRPIPWSH